MKDDFQKKLISVNTFIFDFDGVLSDGKIYTLPDGDQLRATNVKDGYAIQYALKKGYRIAVISGGYSETMKLRYVDFKGMEIFMKVRDKVEKLKEYMAENHLSKEQVMMMGDDIPDCKIMQMAGVKTCPSDACEEIKAMVDYVSPRAGGTGCARDVIEQTLKVQGRWLEEDACLW